MRKFWILGMLIVAGCDSYLDAPTTSSYVDSDPHTAEVKKLNALNSEVRELAGQRRFEEAVEKFEGAIRSFTYPDIKDDIKLGIFALRHKQLAYLEKEREFRKAIPVMRLLIENCYNCSRKKYAIFYGNLALLLKKVERVEEAVEATRSAISYDPDDVSYYVGLAKLLNSLELKQEAFRVLQQAQKVDPDNATVHYMLGEHDLALSGFSKAIEINPRDAEAYFNRGIAYLKKNKHDLAISDFSKTIEIKPSFGKAYFNRGIAYLKENKHDLAISDFSKAIEINPRDAEAYFFRGHAYIEKNEHDSAISDFSKVIEVDPAFAEAYYSRGFIYYHGKGEYDKAWEDIDKAQSLGHQADPEVLKALRKASGREK